MTLTRRHFLRSSSALLTLPWLESLAPKNAPVPVRAAWIYFPNGVSEGAFVPREVGDRGELLALNPTMAPLERHRESLLLPRRMWTPRGNGHGAGTATWLTGTDWDERTLDAGGVSVDQLAGQVFAEDCVVPALTLSARGEGFFSTDMARNILSWQGPRRPVYRETDPRAVYQLLFGGVPLLDRSLLDRQREEIHTLRGRVSRLDQVQLDTYFEALRGLERRLAFVQQESVRRRLEEAHEHGFRLDPAHPPTAVPEDHADYLDLLFELMALALWSGVSRVSTLMLDHGQSNRYCTFVPGVQGTWHALSHWKEASGRSEDDDGFTRWSSVESKRVMYDRVVTWHHERLARFLDRLASLPERDGSLLDHSLVLYGSSIADGFDHSEEDLPLLVAGRGGGAVRPGRALDPGRPTDLSRLHLASLHALGIPARDFGGADTPLDLS